VTAPIRLLAFDLDGVIFRGDTMIPGAASALGELARRGLLLRFVTNNATLARSDVAAKLRAFLIPADQEQILTSAAAAAGWLRSRVAPGSRLLVVGEQGLLTELRLAGFDPRHAGDADVEGAVAVVVGLDRGFSYRMLAQAQAVLARGVPFVATNLDRTLPVEGAEMPGAGALVAAVAAASGREPDVVVGKPGLELVRSLEDATGVPPAQTLMVGDRLETDIVMGIAAGMRTVLVLTGVSRREDVLPGGPQPEAVLDSVADLPRYLAPSEP
jgi:phosphoglycolate/pyridoxal phosphate phosphatase family enzyme